MVAVHVVEAELLQSHRYLGKKKEVNFVKMSLSGLESKQIVTHFRSYLTGRSVRPAVEEDDAVRVFAPKNGHDRTCPDFDALLLQKRKLNSKREAISLVCCLYHSSKEVIHKSTYERKQLM